MSNILLCLLALITASTEARNPKIPKKPTLTLLTAQPRPMRRFYDEKGPENATCTNGQCAKNTTSAREKGAEITDAKPNDGAKNKREEHRRRQQPPRRLHHRFFRTTG